MDNNQALESLFELMDEREILTAMQKVTYWFRKKHGHDLGVKCGCRFCEPPGIQCTFMECRQWSKAEEWSVGIVENEILIYCPHCHRGRPSKSYVPCPAP